MESIMEQAVAKLNTELKGTKLPHMEKPVVEYVLTAMNEQLAAHIMLSHKTLKKCMDYIRDEARKKLHGKNGYLPDQAVFDMAIAYFNLDDAEEEKKKAEKAKKAKEDAEKRRSETDANAQKIKEERDAAQAKKDQAKAAKGSQLSLFDLAGTNEKAKTAAPF